MALMWKPQARLLPWQDCSPLQSWASAVSSMSGASTMHADARPVLIVLCLLQVMSSSLWQSKSLALLFVDSLVSADSLS